MSLSCPFADGSSACAALESQLTSNSTVPLSVNREETVCKEATRSHCGIRRGYGHPAYTSNGAGPVRVRPRRLRCKWLLHCTLSRITGELPNFLDSGARLYARVCVCVCVQLTKGVVGHRAQRASSGRW